MAGHRRPLHLWLTLCRTWGRAGLAGLRLARIAAPTFTARSRPPARRRVGALARAALGNRVPMERGARLLRQCPCRQRVQRVAVQLRAGGRVPVHGVPRRRQFHRRWIRISDVYGHGFAATLAGLHHRLGCRRSSHRVAGGSCTEGFSQDWLRVMSSRTSVETPRRRARRTVRT